MFTCPLTPQQKRLWVEWKLNPQGHYYNINAQFKLSGYLDLERFYHAVKTAVSFFEAFRTGFTEENGVPYQVISPEAKELLEIIDLTKDSSDLEQNEQIARQLLTDKPREPINLKADLPLRFCLIKVSEEAYYFIMINAHILSDGLSAKLVFEAISAVYNDDQAAIEKFRQNAQLSVVEYLKSLPQENKEKAEYWQQTLEQSPLSVRIGSKPTQSRAGGRTYFTLEETDYQAIKAMARKEGATLFTLLAATFSVFIYRHFNTQDIVFTYPVNIRPSTFARTFGFYVSNIPLRVKLSATDSFSDVIKQINARRRADREFEDCSVDEIIKQLRKSNIKVPEFPFNISLGQTSFSLQCLQLGSMQVEALRCDPAETHADISLQYDGSASTLGFYWEYKSELFSESDISYLTESFLTLLRQVTKDPALSIQKISILSEAQSASILHYSQGPTPNHFLWGIWNSFAAKSLKYPFDYSMVDPLEAEAMRYPQAIAVKTQNTSLTYKELNIRANQMARHLRDRGVKTGDMVAICMERSELLVVALAAILRAGAAYVPIDPKHPIQRIKDIIEDCRPAAIVTAGHYRNKLSDYAQLICCLDDKETIAQIALQSINRPLKNFDAHETAYVIYTSGSSGKPKGVMVSHRNVNARIGWLQRTIRLKAADRLLQTINPSFDPSVYEFFWPLSVGATLVLPAADVTNDPEALADIIDQEQVSFMTFVPSLLRVFMKKLKEGQCQSLRHVICGGEVLPPALASDFLVKIPAKLYNVYGPTEGTILASYHECQPGNDETLPIGRPVDDTAIYILNEQLQLQPVGVVGEMYLGGVGVAQGYLNRLDLTDEKFIADPFSTVPQAKLYKTGDLARYLADGNIEFIGRADEQVKIRGFRVELGEIEHAICAIEGIKQAAVVTQSTSAGLKLIAYYTPDHCSPETMREYLETTLPSHMVPSFFMPMGQLPLTGNGKVDKTALPEPHYMQIVSTNVRPLTAMELRLRSLFAQLLEVDAEVIGLEDKFFDVGGDSLQAIELSLLVEKEFNVELSDTILFEYPSVLDLAQHLQSIASMPLNTAIEERVNNRQRARQERLRQRVSQ